MQWIISTKTRKKCRNYNNRSDDEIVALADSSLDYKFTTSLQQTNKLVFFELPKRILFSSKKSLEAYRPILMYDYIRFVLLTCCSKRKIFSIFHWYTKVWFCDFKGWLIRVGFWCFYWHLEKLWRWARYMSNKWEIDNLLDLMVFPRYLMLLLHNALPKKNVFLN